ncbi:NAD-dependent epimerase/dehydratase family protein [Pseudonocardia acaciae]|uniref:NAD-dependent epimerase/dehydratase family protein n=1 Tax=Pseudonocardia acaciae TaxID=551276 RepID=UPI0004909A53|nr:NAD(P)-dependent oxidoreductase [Pseudonocardia acaciae]
MNVTVTGAAGRLGWHLLGLLTENGHRVTGLDRSPAPGELPEGARFVQASLSDTAAGAFDGADVVVHLAALMSWDRADDRALFEANVSGTASVASAAAQAGATLVFASSGEVYPEVRPAYQPLDEAHPTRPTSTYGLTKLLGEQTVEFHRRARGLRAVVLRFSHFQHADELLDETSFFSGPRFFLHRKLAQQRAFGNRDAVQALEPLAAAAEPDTLLLSRGEDGTPYRMGILDARDLAAGVLAAVDRAADLDGQVIGLGPDDSVDFDKLVPELAARAGLPLVDARLPGPAVHYTTSHAKARDLLGFRVARPIDVMIEDAAVARARRLETTRSP